MEEAKWFCYLPDKLCLKLPGDTLLRLNHSAQYPFYLQNIVNLPDFWICFSQAKKDCHQ